MNVKVRNDKAQGERTETIGEEGSVELRDERVLTNIKYL
jgi:hypothetical protein